MCARVALVLKRTGTTGMGVAGVSVCVLAKKSDLCIILFPCVFLHRFWGTTAARPADRDTRVREVTGEKLK